MPENRERPREFGNPKDEVRRDMAYFAFFSPVLRPSHGLLYRFFIEAHHKIILSCILPFVRGRQTRTIRRGEHRRAKLLDLWVEMRGKMPTVGQATLTTYILRRQRNRRRERRNLTTPRPTAGGSFAVSTQSKELERFMQLFLRSWITF